MNSFWDSLKVMSVVSLDVLSENRKGLASQEYSVNVSLKLKTLEISVTGFHVDVLAVSVSDKKFAQPLTVTVMYNICYDVPGPMM